MSNREDLGKLLLRLSVAGVLLFHGIFKLTQGVEWIKQPLTDLGLPGFMAYGTYVAEVVAPLLLIIGFKARLAALVIALDLLMAITLVLRHQVFVIKQGGGGWGIELEALIALSALTLVLIGSGRYRAGKGAWD